MFSLFCVKISNCVLKWLYSWVKWMRGILVIKKLKNPKSGYWLLVSFISFQALGFSFQRRTLRLFYSPSFGSFRPLSPEIFAVHSSHSHFCLLSAFRCTVSSSCLIVFLSVCRLFVAGLQLHFR